MSSIPETTTHPARPSLPVDRGWAWLVMLGAFINTAFCFSFIRSLSIFFIAFLDKFQQSATMTTLSFGLNTAAFSISAILVPPFLLSRFSVRTVTLAGCAINAGSIIGLAFSPNIICINVFFVALGLSHPLIFISQVTLLGVYFKKRLSFAVACANLGLSVGMMAGPPLTQFLLNTYGLLGALLIHGGLNLHNIASCLLFRPPSFYDTSTTAADHEENETSVTSPGSDVKMPEFQLSIESFDPKMPGNDEYNDTDSTRLDGDILIKVIDHACLEKERLIDDTKVNTDIIIPTHPRLNSLKGHEILRSKSLKSLDENIIMNGKSQNSVIVSKNNPHHHHHRHTGSERNIAKSKLSLTDVFSSGSGWKILEVISSSKSVKHLSNSSLGVDSILYSSPKLTAGSESDINDGRYSQTSKMLDVDNFDQTSLDVESIQNSGECKVCCSSPSSNSVTQKSVYLHPLGIMLLLISGIGVNTQCAAAYMPSLGKEQGLGIDQLPYLMTIIGACDLCKIGIGLLADQGWVRRIHIVCICQIVMGTAFQLAVFFRGFVPMIMLCVIFGVNAGNLHILLPGITIDLLGAEFIGQIMSGYFLINGVVMSLTHILIGWLKDETDSFIGGYHFIGGLVLFSAVVILLEPVIKSFVPREERASEPNAKRCCRC